MVLHNPPPTGIDCNDADYKKFRVVVVLFIFVYQSIPMSWMILLYQARAQLDPSTSGNDHRLALHVRDNDHSLDAIRFLFNDYRCEKWWFEVAEMYR